MRPDAEIREALDSTRLIHDPNPGRHITRGVSPTLEFRYPLVPFDQINLDASPEHLIKNLLPRTGFAVVWGPPKCGKSFWAFDLGMHIALGYVYRGRRVRQGTVVYVAGEGQHGFKKRVEAFRQKRLESHEKHIPFYLIGEPLNLIESRQVLVEDIRRQLGERQPVLVVLDTLNRTLHGSENDPTDMGQYVNAADHIRSAFDCAVLVIHHCGIEGTRPRGHSSLTGAVDAQFAVTKTSNGVATVAVEYMKDGPEGDAIAFRLEQVEIGKDEDGDPVTSCIVVEEKVPASESRDHVTGQTKVAFNLLNKAITEAGELPPGSNHIPPNTSVVSVALWRQYCYMGGLCAADNQDARQKAFKRACDRLVALGKIKIWNDCVWATAYTDRHPDRTGP